MAPEQAFKCASCGERCWCRFGCERCHRCPDCCNCAAADRTWAERSQVLGSQR